MKRNKWGLIFGIGMVLSLLIAVLPVATVQASGWTVTSASANPNTSGTLPYALENFNPGDTISFSSSLKGATITWNSSFNNYTLKKKLTINGDVDNDGVADITINGNGYPIFKIDSSKSVVLKNLIFINGYNGTGGAIWNNDSKLTISNCTFSNNTGYTNGGALYNDSCSPTITGCTFTNNTGTILSGGGAIYNSGSSSPVISNCVFKNNSAYSGGAIYFADADSPVITNCVFFKNSASSGGFGGAIGYYNTWFAWHTSKLTITNCTFYGNSSGHGGCIYAYHVNPLTVTNSILYGDTASADSNEIYNTGCTMAVTYTNYQGGYPGTGNINSNPLFVDTLNGDLHLQSIAGHYTSSGWITDARTSPCIDAGNPSSAWSNEPANNGGRINMGAYGNTVYASKTPYTLTTAVSPAGTGSITAAVVTGASVQTYNLTATASSSDYYFNMWSGDLRGSGNPANITLNSNKSVTANFSNQYTLTVDPTSHGTISGYTAGAAYDYGETVQLTATPEAGFSFSGWIGDLSGNTSPATLTMNGNKTVGASFSQDSYTLTVNPTSHGTISGYTAGATYNYGETVQLTAIPDLGYVFTGWGDDLNGQSAKTVTLNMTGNKTVSASFKESVISAGNFWYLFPDLTLDDRNIPSGTYDIGKTETWNSYSAAQADVTFFEGPWTIVINTDEGWSSDCQPEIGVVRDGVFSAFGSLTSSDFYNDGVVFTYSADGFTLPEGDFIAVQVTNSSGSSHIIHTDGNSYLSIPDSQPTFPVPEASSLILLALGMGVLAAVIFGKKRQIRQAI